ncbi:methyltransferase domain-containing protein [bacterium]|nr:methyltransferase domain-containing protein [bacterium]
MKIIIFLASIFYFILNSCAIDKSTKRSRQMSIANSSFINNLDSMKAGAAAEFSVYNIQKGDCIADIGVGPAWFEGYCMLVYDSITLFAEDISRQNLRNIAPVVAQYSTLRSHSTQNNIHAVLGKKDDTRLKKGIFDKVIVRETFHHFSDPMPMLQNLKSLLKPDGRLYIYEPKLEETIYNESCEAPNYGVDELLSYFKKAGFKLESKNELSGNPGNVAPWWPLNPSMLEDKLILVYSLP